MGKASPLGEWRKALVNEVVARRIQADVEEL